MWRIGFLRRLALLLLSGALLAGGSAGAAGPVRIAILVSQEGAPYQDMVNGFRQAMQQGREAEIVVHALQNDSARARSVVKREVEQKAHLLFAVGTLAVQVAVREAPATPLVAGLVLNAGDFLSAPNATGVVLELPLETELRWLQRLLPNQKHVGILYNPAQNQARVTEAARLAKSLGLEVHAHKVVTPRELPDAMESLANQVGVLWGLTDTLVLNPQTAQSLLLFSYRNRIPFVGLSRPWVKAGALYALERDYPDMGRQCGELAIKVLQGTPAGSLSPETPYKIGYSINLKTAQHMKIEFPAALVKGALEAIE